MDVLSKLAELIEDPKDAEKFWKLDDDQSKAVTGICLIFGVLFVIGLFANLTSV